MAIYYVLQPKARKQIRDLTLFHEVALDTTVSGFPFAEIEIVFNDEDHRFPTIGTDIVKLKWVMGTKKDSIFLNEKAITLENWDNLLKTAGFLRGNCFVIHQGEKIDIIDVRFQFTTVFLFRRDLSDGHVFAS